MQASIIALIVNDDKRANLFQKNFEELLHDKTKPTLKNKLSIERFKTIGDFLKAQRERKNLSGTVIDTGVSSEASDLEKRALQMLDELQIPTLKVSEKIVTGDAVDRKILLGKWMQLMDQVESFAPRGLRIHSRKHCYIKIRYHKIGSRLNKQGPMLQAEAKAITFDLSSGGCFIVSTEDWSNVDHVSIIIGEYPEPIPCRVAWRLPWGSTPWKMPGIGVEFVQIDEKLRNYLDNYLRDL